MKSKMKIWIEAFSEDITPEEAQRTCGYTSDFADAVRKVEAKAEAPWGWCTVKVTVNKDQGLGVAWLGQCSYLNEQDFMENSGYFLDMVKEALQQRVSYGDTLRQVMELCGK